MPESADGVALRTQGQTLRWRILSLRPACPAAAGRGGVCPHAQDDQPGAPTYRDIKPDNIFLSRDEQNILLSDWASASFCEEEEVSYQGTYEISDRPSEASSFFSSSSSPGWGMLLHDVLEIKDDLVALAR